jgi:hypothetical protein
VSTCAVPQPPAEVIDAFREVQAAQQERDRLEKEADAYANKVTAAPAARRRGWARRPRPIAPRR